MVDVFYLMNLSLRFYFRRWSSGASNEYFYHHRRQPHQFLSARSGFLHPPLHAELTRTLHPMSPEVKAWGFDSAGRRSPVSSRLCLLGGWLVGTFVLVVHVEFGNNCVFIFTACAADGWGRHIILCYRTTYTQVSGFVQNDETAVYKDVVCAFDDLVCLFVLEAMIRRHVDLVRTFCFCIVKSSALFVDVRL